MTEKSTFCYGARDGNTASALDFRRYHLASGGSVAVTLRTLTFSLLSFIRAETIAQTCRTRRRMAAWAHKSPDSSVLLCLFACLIAGIHGPSFSATDISFDDSLPADGSFDPASDDCSEYLRQAAIDADGGIISFSTGTYVFEKTVDLPSVARIDFGSATIVVRSVDADKRAFLWRDSSIPPSRHEVTQQGSHDDQFRKLTTVVDQDHPLIEAGDYIRLGTTHKGAPNRENGGRVSSFPPSYRRVVDVRNNAGSQIVTVYRPYRYFYLPSERSDIFGRAPIVWVYRDLMNGIIEITGGILDLSAISEPNVRVINLNNCERVRIDSLVARGGHSWKGSGPSPGVIQVNRSQDVVCSNCVFEEIDYQGQAFAAAQCRRVLVTHNRVDGNSFGIALGSVDHGIVEGNTLQGRYIKGRDVADADVPGEPDTPDYNGRGIKVYGALACTIANNTVESYNTGIRLENSGRTVVSGNHVASGNEEWSKGGNVGIAINHSGEPEIIELQFACVVVQGNVVEGAAIGIGVSGPHNTRNIVTWRISDEDAPPDQVRTTSSVVGGSFDVTICGNVIKNSVRRGIRSHGSRVAITGNQISNFGSEQWDANDPRCGIELYGKHIMCYGNSIFSGVTDDKVAIFVKRGTTDVETEPNHANMPLLLDERGGQ